MKNIHVLTTDKQSRLYLGNNGNFVFGMIQTSIQSRNNDFTNQNIYITNDEGIKEGDWVITNNGLLAKVITELTWHFINSKKIILTTDQDLISDGIAQISEDVLLKIVEQFKNK